MTREEALNKVRQMSLPKETMEILEALAPELAESDDERIRKELLKEIEFIIPRNGETDGEGLILPSYHARIDRYKSYLEKQKDASKAIEAVERIDKCIDDNLANAHDMKDSNPDKKYYRGWDDALGKMAGILQDVYSDKKQKEQKPECDNETEVQKAYREGKSAGRQEVFDHPEEYGLQKEQKTAEKQDYSGLNDLERAIHRGFLCAGVENVPVAIIKQTAKECIAQMKPAEWNDEDKRQMEILQYVCTQSSHSNQKVIPVLESLYNDLKKL